MSTKPKDYSIQVATIDHRYGSNFYLAHSKEDLDQNVADYCRMWWAELLPTVDDEESDEESDEAPEDNRRCIDEYFERHDGEGITYAAEAENIASLATPEHIAFCIIREVMADPFLRTCRTFAELGDHCDHNMLGFEEWFVRPGEIVDADHPVGKAQALVDAFLGNLNPS